MRPGDRACSSCSDWEEPGEVFVAAALALESVNEDRLNRVLELAVTSYELSRALISAIAWLPPEAAAQRCERVLAADDAALRRIGIAASAVCRRDPGDALARAIEDQAGLLRARDCAVGELGRLDLLGAVRNALDDEDAGCRSAAAWTAALLTGESEAIGRLQRLVESGADSDQAALQLVLRRLDGAEAKAWLLNLATKNPNLARRAVIGAGRSAFPIW